MEQVGTFLDRLSARWDLPRTENRLEGTPLGTVRVECPRRKRILRVRVVSQVEGEEFSWRIHLPSGADPCFLEHWGLVFTQQAKGWLADRDTLEERIGGAVKGLVDVQSLPPSETRVGDWEISMVRHASPSVIADFSPMGKLKARFCAKAGGHTTHRNWRLSSMSEMWRRRSGERPRRKMQSPRSRVPLDNRRP